MRHWIAIGIWGAASALVLSSTTRASGDAADGGVEDASTIADGGIDDADAGDDDAGAKADAGADDAGSKADAGDDDAGRPAPLPEYDLIQRDDGGRACSAGSPGGRTRGLSLAVLFGLSAAVVARRRRRG